MTNEVERTYSGRKWLSCRMGVISLLFECSFSACLIIANKEMFKKAKRANFRRRNESDEDEREDNAQPMLAPTLFGPVLEEVPFLETSNNNNHNVSLAPSSNGFTGSFNSGRAPKKDKKVKDSGALVIGPTKASLLSFDDEEEGGSDVFRVKKSNHSKKIVKQLKKEYKEDLEKGGVAKSDAPPLPIVAVKEEVTTSNVGGDHGEEEMEVDSADEQEEEVKGQGTSQVSKSSSSSNTGTTFNTLSSLSTLRPGEIPDAAFIHAARKRRQLARELGGDAPLVETEATQKRLAQEDQDGSDDEDEDEKRIRFSGVRSKTQRQKIAEEIGIEGSDDEALDAGADEEVSRWEQEQIRKGISIPQVQSSQPEDNTAYYQNSYDAQPYGASYSMPFTYSTVPPQAGKPPGLADNGSVHFGVSVSDLAPVSIDLVKKRLQDRLSHMHAGHNANIKRYRQIQEELTTSENTIQQLDGSSNDHADQYKFLQEMRGYVGDLLECFGEKVPAVLELEAAMHQLLRQRASRLVQRRQDDIKDESAEFASLSNKAVMAPNLDLFGRDRALYQENSRQRRIAEREARRARRRQAREQNGKWAEHKEGLSSDDEETSTDITSFDMEHDRITRECKKVFEDVVEDFHSLDYIKSQFEAWRRDYADCYRDAYIALCLPKLFSPLVRLQLITWNPLEAQCANFEYMLWFESLLFYGFEENSTLQKGDSDIGLLPAIVEKVILSKLTVLSEQVWDPLSNSQSVRLVAFIRRLMKSYPTVLHGDNQYTRELLKTVVLRVRRTLDEDVFQPLYPKNLLENKNGGPYLFYQRQFWTCVKLLGNILQWEGILSPSCLKDLALDSTLNRYILSALQTTDISEDNVYKSQKVVECLPLHWFSGLKDQQTLPQLEPLCRYLVHLANSLYRSSLGASDTDRRATREQVKEIVKMLAHMKAVDHIIAVAAEQGIKDIKPLLEAKS
ncbi:PAX3- and PAX7-binding protein 1 isoform X2 [Dunckerocampus dactyliophorus]|uniref:PAX3- and PAX7-binding protein 1 isoform X2 n=1 Tax=Dunckerocampus dactyliophorus TaxID=161453 RepID=UPI0024067902|nr:PAX3- and PAX7-binding protein 1 isoform X2 [Dunckerocampus dactyliophorus]